MSIENEEAACAYTPVDCVYREVASEELLKGTCGKIFYYTPEQGVLEAEGRLTAVEEVDQTGVFLFLDSGERVRIDRVITMFGKPGAAYEAYDAYANACMDFMGGFAKDDF